MEEKKSKAVALFRYGVIAPILNDDNASKLKYFKEMSQKELKVPNSEKRKKYCVSTFKEWYRKYKNGGLDALHQTVRSDKGISKKIDEKIHSEIKTRIDKFPYLSASGIHRMLIKEGVVNKFDFTENTLRTYINVNNLRKGEKTIVGRKKFEAPAINILWIADFMHCYSIKDSNDHNRKKKTYLCGIIDDHSRLLVGGGFFFNENSIALATTLKRTILQYGIVKKFYCDNGAVFSTQYLQEACARVRIALIHSRPYDSPSRGKIERFFGTVRRMFLPITNFNEIKCLEELNDRFCKWIDQEYHKNTHSGIKDTPKNKYLLSLAQNKIHRISETELDIAFYKAFTRKVKNDSTISIEGKLYEVPPEYIASKLEFRSPLDKPKDLSLFIKGKPVCKIKPVNTTENFEKPYTGIHFDKELSDD